MAKHDYLEIGCTPAAEDAAQVGSDGYYERMRRETSVYIRQLRRVHGIEPAGARLTVKSFPHDFGTYHEVVCYFDPEIPESVEYAFKLEGSNLEHWDETALRELGR
jgi:hypothetical protein